MNGAFGCERYGLSSTLRTVKVAGARPVASERAVGSSRATASPTRRPDESKSLPVATRRPSTATRVAVNDGDVAVVSSMSQ